MYCTKCGHFMAAEEARFCTSCGAALNGGTAAGASVGMSQTPPVGESSATPVNFKAAMDSTKARGKRRMPIIVLVALALALTSAIAFAAHYVYSEYIAPARTEARTIWVDYGGFGGSGGSDDFGGLGGGALEQPRFAPGAQDEREKGYEPENTCDSWRC